MKIAQKFGGVRPKRTFLILFVILLILAIVVFYFVLKKFYTHERWQSVQIAELSQRITAKEIENVSLLEQITDTSAQIEIQKQQIAELSQDVDKLTSALDSLTSTMSVYQKLKLGLPVNIIVIGDSIGECAGASDYSRGWVSILKNWVTDTYGSDVSVTNVSMGGNSSYAGYVRTMTLPDTKKYDLAVICYGQNDAVENFDLYYECMIRAVRARWENCALISILESSQKTYTEKMQVILSLADYYEIPVADTIEPFQKNYYDLMRDGVHPNDAGYMIYAQTVEAVIGKAVENDVGLLENKNPVNKDVYKFDNFVWHGKDEFIRDGNTYRLALDVSGVMGIDYTFVSGENTCKIFVDGKVFAAPEVSFNYDFSQRHILIVDEESVEVKNEIEISFSSTEQADGFNGICFSEISE